ncbi:unnamed protein product [Rotaria sordida]|uniref:Hint domain-containing protein n=1 Tax=Rotaria sordida TaxID=392033 RepID=A0A819AK67_9BILA|nr:unnamed protein product [Rotaria sordida]CAF1169048.1 unnamed protein product [Rotaria sordida]CAF3727065.1 unnamed protein product [Rotaria sordida]CAF3785953.1 unnamed protein product [Rotaria sordida]
MPTKKLLYFTVYFPSFKIDSVLALLLKFVILTPNGLKTNATETSTITTTTTTPIPTTTTTRITKANNTATTSRKSPGCFASNTSVRLATGHLKQISNLHVGDLIFVKRENQIITSPILAIFRHYRSLIRFVDIYTTDSIIPLRLTPLHSLLVLPKQDKHERYLFAKDVSIGSHVFSSDLRLLTVVNIKEVLISDDNGYTILTFEGNIIVNDIVASCYATYDHSIMHMMTMPMRWWFLILFQLRQLIEFDYLQQLTNKIIVSFVDFYLQAIY